MQHGKEQGQQQGSQMTPQQQFGAHELLDADEAIGTLVGGIEHFVIYDQYAQDAELTSIMQQQKTALTQIYNTILETLQSGMDPSIKTQTYEMQRSNQTTYGMQQQSTPTTPIQSVNELNDECISNAILGHLKS